MQRPQMLLSEMHYFATELVSWLHVERRFGVFDFNLGAVCLY